MGSVGDGDEHVLLGGHFPDGSDGELVCVVVGLDGVGNFVLKVLSFPFAVLFDEFESPELDFLLHGAFPPDELASKVGSSDCVLVGPGAIIFKGENGL